MDRIDLPFACAVVAGGVLTLNRWDRSLMRDGPGAMLIEGLAARGVAIADLTRCGEVDDELVATFARGSAHGPEVDEPLVAWTATVGYRRLWLPGRVVDLRGVPAVAGAAAVTCPTCGTAWCDEGARFWEGVRAGGHFPARCRACGGSLPEWRVTEPAHAAPAPSHEVPARR